MLPDPLVPQSPKLWRSYRHRGICGAGVDLLSLLSSTRDYAYRARSFGRRAIMAIAFDKCQRAASIGKMGAGPRVSDFVDARATWSYSKLWPALPRRYSSSSRPSSATDDDVSTTCSWRSSRVIRDSHWGALWSPPYPNPKFFLAIVVTQVAMVFMCSQSWLVSPLPWGIIGFVWAYNLAWMVVQGIVNFGICGILDPGSFLEEVAFPATSSFHGAWTRGGPLKQGEQHGQLSEQTHR